MATQPQKKASGLSGATLAIIAVVVVMVLGVLAFVLTKKDDNKASAAITPSTAPNAVSPAEFQAVNVEGDALPNMPGTTGGADDGIGKQAPVVTGYAFDGSPISFAPEGKPRLIFFLAHWCPHCNRELPVVVSAMKAKALDKSIDVAAVATGTNKAAVNYPPSEWIAKNQFIGRVLVDDKVATAYQAYGAGGAGYPYAILLDASGKLLWRHSGEILAPGESNPTQAALVAEINGAYSASLTSTPTTLASTTN